MASIAPALSHIKRQLHAFVPESLILKAAADSGLVWRRRKLTPVLWVHLLLLQLLANVAYQSLRHVSGIAISAQALCRAQRRIPLPLLLKLVQGVCRACSQASPQSLFHAHRVVLADGTSFQVPDSLVLARRYGRAKNQTGYSQSYPVPKLLALLDASTGLIYKVIALPWARQERTCLTRLCKHLAKGDLLLGDRGMVGFAQLAHLMRRELAALMRLPCNQVVTGRPTPTHHLLRRLGKQDLLVRWLRGRRPGWMSRRRFLELPNHLELRQIAFRICRPGYRTKWAWLITTLVDPVAYPAEELVALYARRWQVEVYFRDLKQTLGLRTLRAKTIAGIRKQVLGMVLLYNLVRSIMADAAFRQQVAPDRLSVKDACNWLLWSSSQEPRLLVNPLRTRPTQPRALKGKHRFPRLNRPRHSCLKPPSVARL